MEYVKLLNNMEKTDVDIINDVLEGEDGAYAALVDRHLASVYAFAYRYVRDTAAAEDIAQDAFVRAWKNLKKFDRARNFKTWLFAIAKNAALDLIKKKKPALFSEISEEEEILEAILAPYITDDITPGELFDRAEERRYVLRMIQALPIAYRTVLSMR